jgi:hypothetical protein
MIHKPLTRYAMASTLVLAITLIFMQWANVQAGPEANTPVTAEQAQTFHNLYR